jgi:hypothetical protein
MAGTTGKTARLLEPDTVVIEQRDASGATIFDYVTFCNDHRWASLPSPFRPSGRLCPECQADADRRAWRRRYDDLQSLLLRGL